VKTVGVRLIAILLISACFLSGASAPASPVAVLHKEGSVHGFLVLSNLDGTPLAEGDLTQVPEGNRITSRLVYHFKDGSRQEERSSSEVEFRRRGWRVDRRRKPKVSQKAETEDATTGESRRLSSKARREGQQPAHVGG